MRKSNKIIALVLSIILTVSMSATVFAATKAKPNEWDSFGTSAEGPKYPQIRGEYRTVDSLVGIKKKQKEKGKREFLKVGSDFGNSLSVFIRA